MARVLFAWEFGGDLGHARRTLPIARELRALGHEPIFAFRDLSPLGPFVHEEFEWHAAPILRPMPRPNPSPLNPSDILLNLGYADAAALAGALRAWRSLLDLLAPQVVVSDYAPTALLAARAANIARVTIGTGFSQPRLADPLPALRDWHAVDDAVLRDLDARLVDCIAKAFAHLPPPAMAPRSATEVFDAQAHLLCTWPEIDPLGPRDDVEYLGPQGDAETGLAVDWGERRGPRVLAYLKPRDARFLPLLRALTDWEGEAIVAAPGLSPAQAAELTRGSKRVFAEPLRLDPLLAEADLCVFPAGPGFAARAIVAGVPMALLPAQLEQYLVGLRLVEAGVAGMTSPEDALPDPRAWLESIASNTRLRDAARELARRHAGYRFDAAARRSAERIATEAAR